MLSFVESRQQGGASAIPFVTSPPALAERLTKLIQSAASRTLLSEAS